MNITDSNRKDRWRTCRFFVFHSRGDWPSLMTLSVVAVKPEFMRRGVASQLFEAVKGKAESLGLEEI